MGITIRKMEHKDINAVQRIAEVSWNHTYEGIIPLEIQTNFLKSAYNDDMMEKRLEQSIIFVSELEGTVVGFANFSPVNYEGEVELGAIYLNPENQGRGIGTALLNKGIETITGVKEIYINVEKENKIGTNFYVAKGFQVVKEFDDNFDGHILKTVRMVLKV